MARGTRRTPPKSPEHAPAQPAYDRLPTEALHPDAVDLDALPTHQIVDLLARREAKSLAAVRRAAPAIARVADAVAAALAAGGRLIYVGAGTSGRLGVLDASECPPTFGTDPAQVVGVLAGGAGALTRAAEGAEDRGDDASRMLAALEVGAGDVVVGIAASGVTPFVLAGLRTASTAGAFTALITCAADAARKATGPDLPDVLVGLEVGPEILAGSTRLGAGTATKIALNAITTSAMVRAGRTYGPYMVDLRASSTKLHARATRLVRELAALSADEAASVLAAADGEVKTAIVMARLGKTAADARTALNHAGGRLRDLLGPPPRSLAAKPRTR